MGKRTYGSLAEYLKATGQTQADVADLLGIPQGQFSLYVRRLQEPRLGVALRIAARTGVTLEGLRSLDRIEAAS